MGASVWFQHGHNTPRYSSPPRRRICAKPHPETTRPHNPGPRECTPGSVGERIAHRPGAGSGVAYTRAAACRDTPLGDTWPHNVARVLDAWDAFTINCKPLEALEHTRSDAPVSAQGTL